MNFLNAQLLLEYSSQNEMNEKNFVTFINIGVHKMQKKLFVFIFLMLLDFWCCFFAYLKKNISVDFDFLRPGY